jgi:hypothetical protein
VGGGQSTHQLDAYMARLLDGGLAGPPVDRPRRPDGTRGKQETRPFGFLRRVLSAERALIT